MLLLVLLVLPVLVLLLLPLVIDEASVLAATDKLVNCVKVTGISIHAEFSLD